MPPLVSPASRVAICVLSICEPPRPKLMGAAPIASVHTHGRQLDFLEILIIRLSQLQRVYSPAHQVGRMMMYGAVSRVSLLLMRDGGEG